MIYIYQITNTNTNQSYIGQTNNPDGRLEKHMTGSHNATLRKDIERYGKESFQFDIIDEHEDQVYANYSEIRNIEETRNLYNKSIGGQLVQNHDKAVCHVCENTFGTVLNICSSNPGLLLFAIDGQRNISRLIILCGKCRIEDGRRYSGDRKTYPLSKMMTGTALMDLVLNYNVPEELINKLIFVDGKMNQRMAYAYFTKRLGYAQ